MTSPGPATSSTSESSQTRTSVGGEIAPLAERVRALTGLRLLVCVAVLSLMALGGQLAVREALIVSAAYLSVTMLLGLVVSKARRWLGLRAFSIALLLDAAYLQYLFHEAGHRLGVQFAIAAFLIAVTLLGSFRTGIKIGIWSSILLVVVHQAELGGLITNGGELPTELTLAADLVLMWIVVFTAATAGAINERELRRRRYDAEVLRRLATAQHRSELPEDVLDSFLTFARSELDTGRALLCQDSPSGLILVQGSGLKGTTWAPPQHATNSPFLQLLSGGNPVLALRLDPARDPWLAAHLPDATKLIAVRLVRGDSPVYLVMELMVKGSRVERRVVGTLEQAAATTALALSRADLLVQARRSASTDGLTGAWNRRTFDAELSRNVSAALRDGTQLSLIMVDVDHFKKVNDVHGHQIGDEVLVLVARTLAEVLEHAGVGTAYRYGGEEFSVILPAVTPEQAAAVAERLRAALQAARGPVSITASFGLSSFGPHAADQTRLLLRADAALLQAKQTGRNRVTVFDGSTHLPSIAAEHVVPAPRPVVEAAQGTATS